MRNEFAVDSRKLPEQSLVDRSSHGDVDVVLQCQIRTQKSESAQDIEQEPRSSTCRFDETLIETSRQLLSADLDLSVTFILIWPPCSAVSMSRTRNIDPMGGIEFPSSMCSNGKIDWPDKRK
jgi:hypothetical protein